MAPILFAAVAAIVVVAALMVVLHRNPVTSALFLVVAFCGLAGLYLLLRAEFVAMVQIVVYAGAIMVLFLFVIMYLNLRQDLERGMQSALRTGIGWLVGALVLVQGVWLFGRGWSPGPVQPAPPAVTGNTEAIGALLFSRYVFPFEVTGLLLLVAMIGAVFIARGRRDAGGPPAGRGAAGGS